MRRATGLGALLLLGLCLTDAACSGAAGRNCLVIPAQIEIVQERREAELKKLETTAGSVDQMRSSLERIQQRLKELQAEKALLEQMDAKEK